MHCTVRVYLHNDHFSQEYADEHNNGQESELNRRFEWEDELEIVITSYSIHYTKLYEHQQMRYRR